MVNKAKGRRGRSIEITSRKHSEWTAVHSPRVWHPDCPPATSWWADTPPEEFSARARQEFDERMRRSDRSTGQRGIE